MASAGTVLTAKILAKHGARPDCKQWRNETAGAWVGKVKGRTNSGNVVLRGARMIQAGLCVGSADIVGLTNEGRFIAIEVKAGKDRLKPHQKRWLDLVESLGGLVIVATCVQDVTDVLGEPPCK